MGKLIDPRPRDVSMYVSASVADIAEAQRVAKVLRAHAVEVTSTWHDSFVSWKPGPADVGGNGEEIAATCLTEILSGDWFLQLTTGNASTSGCMHVELGFAIGVQRPIVLVGRPTHPMHHLRCVKQCGSIEEFMMGLMTARVKGARMAAADDRLRDKRGGRLRGQRGDGAAPV